MPEPVVDDPGPGPATPPDAGAVAAYGAAPAVIGPATPPDAVPEPDAAGSGGLRVEGLSVVYPAGRGSDPVRAVDDVDLTLPRGRILALLGPSGCGKSSLLRAVAGLEEIAAGTIAWDGADVVGVPVHKRGFGLMFQDGQLFPFRDVAGNVAYGLVHLPRARRRERVAEMLELVGLPGYGGRDVTTLSGGQAQRVALARAIARRPGVLLYDEPLSNLDALLRDRTRAELKLLHNEIGATSIYVTHDQEEAMSLSHKIAVMSRGRLEQYGSPEEIYSRPATEFVAGFVGKPRMNLFTAEPLERGLVAVPGTGLKVDLELMEFREKIRIGLRPSECHVVSASEEAAAGRVAVIEPLGAYSDVIVDIGGGELFVARESGFPEVRVGDHVTIDLRDAVRHVFDIETGLRCG